MSNDKKQYSEKELKQAQDADISTDMELAEVPMQDSKYIKTEYLNPVIWSQMKGMATMFHKSGALPKHLDSVEKVIVQMQTGVEMGMKPMESIQSLYIVHGNVNIWGKATVKALRKHGWRISYPDESDTHCTAKVVNMENPDDFYEETFEYQEAVDSGYTMDNYNKPKVGWKKGANRKMKMRYNALSRIIKSYIPEVLEGVAEIQEVAEDVEFINVEGKTVNKGGKVKNVSLSTPKEEDAKIKAFLNCAKQKKEGSADVDTGNDSEPQKEVSQPDSEAIEGEMVENKSKTPEKEEKTQGQQKLIK